MSAPDEAGSRPVTAPRSAAPARARLAIFDMSVTSKSPAGSCVLAELKGLASAYDITLFSNGFESFGSTSTRWIPVPVPDRPVFLRYWVFQTLAPMYFWWWKLRGNRADLLQATEGQYVGAHIVYAHFCHQAYLEGPWRTSTVHGLRRFARWINHKFNARFERLAFARAVKIVVPSRGLAAELARTYPQVGPRVETLANPVDVARFARPATFDRESLRHDLGFSADDTVFAFMALGDFGRKGLGIVIAALSQLSVPTSVHAKVLVIGGQPSEIKAFRDLAERAGVLQQLEFVGMQDDVRPFLWAADVYAFPSAYEIFSLAILQAAAAGLPVIVSEGLYGAEEFIVEGVNGWHVPRSEEGVAAAMIKAVGLGDALNAMGRAAELSTHRYTTAAFQERWKEVYAAVEKGFSA